MDAPGRTSQVAAGCKQTAAEHGLRRLLLLHACMHSRCTLLDGCWRAAVSSRSQLPPLPLRPPAAGRALLRLLLPPACVIAALAAHVRPTCLPCRLRASGPAAAAPAAAPRRPSGLQQQMASAGSRQRVCERRGAAARASGPVPTLPRADALRRSASPAANGSRAAGDGVPHSPAFHLRAGRSSGARCRQAAPPAVGHAPAAVPPRRSCRPLAPVPLILPPATRGAKGRVVRPFAVTRLLVCAPALCHPGLLAGAASSCCRRLRLARSSSSGAGALLRLRCRPLDQAPPLHAAIRGP